MACAMWSRLFVAQAIVFRGLRRLPRAKQLTRDKRICGPLKNGPRGTGRGYLPCDSRSLA
jgi:hypothetical protein